MVKLSDIVIETQRVCEKNVDTPDTSNSAQGNTKILARNTHANTRSRSWFFTLNNFERGDIQFLTDTLDTEKYAFQHEIGDSGTPHLQGVVYFANARDFNSMKALHNKIHWEKNQMSQRSNRILL